MDDDNGLLPGSLRDAVYTMVGLAVLGLQRAQVCRRDAERLIRQARERLDVHERPTAHESPTASR